MGADPGNATQEEDIVCLIVFGSLWVMLHLNHNLMPMDKLMQMQR